MTLHEAIFFVLKKNNNKPMSFSEIADKINADKLFVRPSDNQPVQAFQIKLRTTVSKSYKHHFEEKENGIVLKQEEP